MAPKCIDATYPFIDLGLGKRRVSMAINEGTKPDYKRSSKSLDKLYSYLVDYLYLNEYELLLNWNQKLHIFTICNILNYLVLSFDVKFSILEILIATLSRLNTICKSQIATMVLFCLWRSYWKITSELLCTFNFLPGFAWKCSYLMSRPDVENFRNWQI